MRAAPVLRLIPMAAAGLALLGAVPVAGQDQGAAPAESTAPAPATAAPQAAPEATAEVMPVLTLDRERLFSGSRFGQAVIARFETEAKALQVENRRIDAALEAEERDLTERRATLPAEEFRKLAADFDTRVEQLRSAQDAKSRDLGRQRDEARQRFFDAAVPVMGQLMADHGAVAIIDRAALVLSFERIDITDEAILRLDEVLGDGPDEATEGATEGGAEGGAAAGNDPAPAPDAAPQPQPPAPQP